MRSADPAAYDQFKELTSGTTYNIPFRALYLTNTTGGTSGVATFVISQLEAGVLVEKTIYISQYISALPSFFKNGFLEIQFCISKNRLLKIIYDIVKMLH